jgi:hypothetical protein
MKSYTKKKVEMILKANDLSWDEFIKWMRGQTCPILEDGECGYYQYDVGRYVEAKKAGHTPIIWD